MNRSLLLVEPPPAKARKPSGQVADTRNALLAAGLVLCFTYWNPADASADVSDTALLTASGATTAAPRAKLPPAVTASAAVMLMRRRGLLNMEDLLVRTICPDRTVPLAGRPSP